MCSCGRASGGYLGLCVCDVVCGRRSESVCERGEIVCGGRS